jgi:hypothetical protein
LSGDSPDEDNDKFSKLVSHSRFSSKRTGMNDLGFDKDEESKIPMTRFSREAQNRRVEYILRGKRAARQKREIPKRENKSTRDFDKLEEDCEIRGHVGTIPRVIKRSMGAENNVVLCTSASF